MYYSTTKKLGSKNQKKLFAEGLAWPSAKGVFAEGLANDPRQRIFKKNKKSLPSAWRRALGKDWRQWPPWPIRPYLPRANLPRARPSAKIYFAEGRLFAESQALSKSFFAEGLALPRAPGAGPRQRPPLPSARDLALGKPRSPRQRMGFQ